jgi:hypothetical protein
LYKTQNQAARDNRVAFFMIVAQENPDL